MSFEDFMDKMPVIGSFTRSDEEKALVKKQKQMSGEARARLDQSRQTSMNALGQSMLAFAPQNQMMAQMFGPGAAFSGQQMAQMTADPAGAPPPPPGEIANLVRAWEGKSDQEIRDNMKGTNPSAEAGKRNADRVGAVLDYRRKLAEYERQQAARGAQMEGAFGTPQGPAPIQMPQALPPRGR
jgi:uncharacterized protein YukE